MLQQGPNYHTLQKRRQPCRERARKKKGIGEEAVAVVLPPLLQEAGPATECRLKSLDSPSCPATNKGSKNVAKKNLINK